MERGKCMETLLSARVQRVSTITEVSGSTGIPACVWFGAVLRLRSMLGQKLLLQKTFELHPLLFGKQLFHP
jgi:hypothetical protein